MTCSTATSAERRPVRALWAVVVGALVLAGCGNADDDGAVDDATGPVTVTTAVPRAAPVPDGCSRTAESPSDPTPAEVIGAAEPGDVVCVGATAGGERIAIAVSGTAQAPIVVRGIGSPTTAGFDVSADHVVVEGFQVTGSGRTGSEPGISIEGTGVVVRSNTITAPDGAGIACSDDAPRCTDVVIEDNTVRGADGSGIVVHGERIVVARNDVAGSVRRDASDADGIRFFGSDIEIVANHIHDISDQGYVPADQAPHTDCFQTFDNDRLPTVDVTIHRNTCDRVDHQCLIAEGITQGRSRGLRFADNICRNGGSQGVLLRGMQDVTIVNNLFLAPIEFHGIVAEDTTLTVLDNAFVGSFEPYFVRGGELVADHDLHWDPGDPAAEPDWSEPNGISGVDPLIDPDGPLPAADFAIPRPGSPLIDAGDGSLAGPADLLGRARVADGDGDGMAVVDIGPLEYGSDPGADAAGYLLIDQRGDLYGFGRARRVLAGLDPVAAHDDSRGVTRSALLRWRVGAARVVDIVATADGRGFWVLLDTGVIIDVGRAPAYPPVDVTALTKWVRAGSGSAERELERLATMSALPDDSLWIFSTAGRVLPVGTVLDADTLHDMDMILALDLDGPMVGSTATTSGRGAYLTATDGGVFTLGDAVFIDSVRGRILERDGVARFPDQPVTDIVSDRDSAGYYVAAVDGGVFAIGAPFAGSLPEILSFDDLVAPVGAIVTHGAGYLAIAADGGVFNFSGRPFQGSAAGIADAPVVAAASIA